MSIISGGGAVAGSSVAFQIERSLRFNSADSAYLNRTQSASNRKTWTYSAWVKRGLLGTDRAIFASYSSSVNLAQLYFLAADTLTFYDYTSGYVSQLNTTQVFRDPAAWLHIVISYDTTQGTAANRIKMYVNGTQVTAFATATYPSQNYDGYVNSNLVHYISTYDGSNNTFNGYLTEIHFIDGQALTPSSFGETDTDTGVWKPKAYSGTYGNNGFYLKFADNSGTTAATLGKDSSGNGNNWTPNNFSVTAGAGNDSLVDSPTSYGTDTGAGGEVRGNYATLNPLENSQLTLSNGNLTYSRSGAGSNVFGSFGNFYMSSGKWYWEVTATTASGTNNHNIGVARASVTVGSYNASIPSTWLWSNGGEYAMDGIYSNPGVTWQTNNDVTMHAYDADTGKYWLGKNGTWNGSGNPAAGTNPVATITNSTTDPVRFAVGNTNNPGAFQDDINFGQRAFSYTAPSGFKALCTQNLPTPSINKGSLYFDATLRTGTGASASVSSLNFQPDLVWIKSRSAATNHNLFDSSRGATVGIITIGSVAEYTDANSLTAFNSNGYTLGSDASSRGVNINTNTYVDWVWKKSATPGFDIVLYTGNATNRTISHSLGAAPVFMAVKARSGSPMDEWFNYHQSLGPTKYIRWGQNLGVYTSSGYWNDTAPTSSVFSLGTTTSVNANGVPFVAYLWSEIAGFSRFGSFTGNGSSDGPFVFTGFRPAFVIAKLSSAVGDWNMVDDTRQVYNDASGNPVLRADLASAEEDVDTMQGQMDLLSNGFKLRSNNSSLNLNGGTIIYVAFAENPFKYALAR